MGDLFSQCKVFDNAKSLLRVREAEAVAREIAELETAIYALVENGKAFVKEANRLQLVRLLKYRPSIIAHRKLPGYPSKTFHVPNICWAEYINRRRLDIDDWLVIAKLLDEANASYDERLLHMRIHQSMLEYRLEGRRLVERLKGAYWTQQEIRLMTESQGISAAVLGQQV